MGHHDNSPAFQRRVIAVIGQSPTGTAERLRIVYALADDFILKTTVVPPGLGWFAD